MDDRRNRYSDVSYAFIQMPLMQIRLGIKSLEIDVLWFEKLGESLNHLSNLQSQPSNSPKNILTHRAMVIPAGSGEISLDLKSVLKHKISMFL